MFYIIYKITNGNNNKCYIGVTSRSIQIRFNDHVRKARFGSTSPLHLAMACTDISLFTIEVLHSFKANSFAEACVIENAYIDDHNTKITGYNVGSGVSIPNRKGPNNPMYGKASPNAVGVSIGGCIYPSISAASNVLRQSRNTIAERINDVTRKDYFKL